MPRKLPLSDKEDELSKLIVQYEAMKAENKQIYLDGDQLADIADKYATDRKFKEAQEVITYGLGLHPESTDLMIEQAYLYLDTQKIKKAKETAMNINETYSTEVKLLKAEILLNEENLDAAEAILSTLDEPDELDCTIEVAYLYIDMGYPEKALPWLKKVQEEYSDDDDFLVAMADCYCAIEELATASEYYNKLIDKNPYQPAYWLGLSKCQFAGKDFSKALESIDFALAAEESFGDGHLMRAHCLFHLENEEEAIKEYEKALQYKVLAPEFAYMFIGLTHTNKEEWKQADEYFCRALQVIKDNKDTHSPILSDIYCNQAVCLSELGEIKKAHQLCRKAQKIAPYESDAYLIDGRIYISEGNFEKAKDQWGIALQLVPEADTWYQIGTYSVEFNMIENARLCFEQAWKLDAKIEGLNEQLASVCMILKDHKGFYKYNQLSKIPLDFESMNKSLSGMESSDLIEELKKFMNEVKEDDK